jgi:hypothetical protein
MKSFLQFNEGFEGETKTFTIKADPVMMRRFERMIRYMSWCSGVGHSATIAISVDGDGADRFQVVKPDNLPLPSNHEEMPLSTIKAEIISSRD